MFTASRARRRSSLICGWMGALDWRTATTRSGQRMRNDRTLGRYCKLRRTILRNSSSCGRPFMEEHKIVRHKVGFTDADFKRAIERARKLRQEALASEVQYKAGPGLDLFVVKLTDGS